MINELRVGMRSLELRSLGCIIVHEGGGSWASKFVLYGTVRIVGLQEVVERFG